MLELHIPKESFVDEDERVIEIEATTLHLEHSLLSLKKWEQKWHKPFLDKRDGEKTEEEMLNYIQCMSLDKNVDPNVYKYMSPENMMKVINYIQDPMTAAWFKEEKGKLPMKSSQVVTYEIIYYWMISLNIPVEFEKWHLNALLTLIKIVNIENEPKKKMSKQDEARLRMAENARRRARHKSRG